MKMLNHAANKPDRRGEYNGVCKDSRKMLALNIDGIEAKPAVSPIVYQQSKRYNQRKFN